MTIEPTAQELQEPRTIAPAFLDLENPLSLINVAPSCMAPFFEQLKGHWPRTLLWTESKIRAELKPDERDNRVRLSFWNEYDRATSLHRRMSIDNIIRGVTDRETFLYFYLKKPNKYVWLLTPPKNYVLTMQQILDQSLEALLLVTEVPPIDKKGRLDTKAVNQLIKIFQLVDARVKGAVVQRLQIQQQSVNLNVDATEQQSQLLASMSLEELEGLDNRLEQIADKTGARDEPLKIKPPMEGDVFDNPKAEFAETAQSDSGQDPNH